MSYYPASRRDRICTLTACIVAVLLMLGVAVVLSGGETQPKEQQEIVVPADSPEAQWLGAKAVLTTAIDLIEIAHDQGVISDEDMSLTVGPLILTALDSLDEAESYLPEGGGGFRIAMKFLDDYMGRLREAAPQINWEVVDDAG